MDENILTEKEIRETLEQERQNPLFNIPMAISFGKERHSILRISPIKKIIFIKGDSTTGFEHINDRHSYWSDKSYWKVTDSKIKLDSPSKFSRKSIPIGEYIDIADKLYDASNLNLEKNKKPDLFEMYSGIITDSGNVEMKYHMLLYKGTRIVHTLYPHSDKHKKKIINYVKGKPKAEYHTKNDTFIIAIPYLNNLNIVVYSFQVIKNYENNIEKWVIVHHQLKQAVNIREFPIKEKVEFEEDIRRAEYADLSEIEKIIKQLEENE